MDLKIVLLSAALGTALLVIVYLVFFRHHSSKKDVSSTKLAGSDNPYGLSECQKCVNSFRDKGDIAQLEICVSQCQAQGGNRPDCIVKCTTQLCQEKCPGCKDCSSCISCTSKPHPGVPETPEGDAQIIKDCGCG